MNPIEAINPEGKHRIELIRKEIKTLRITVYSATGRIVVTAPKNMEEQKIWSFVEAKMPWIKQKLSKTALIEPKPDLSYTSGEYHRLEGKNYRLEVIEGNFINRISVVSDTIQLQVQPGTSMLRRKDLLEALYRQRLGQRMQSIAIRWQQIMGVKADEWRIKKMKTRWGSCNIKAKRININLELAKKSDECLEYIIVHELGHFFERYHNAIFYGVMDKYLPDWKKRKQDLNEA
ncbi:MAG: SprT family zinc-dependent metalloprotease [Candidatus Cloacimonetes bacterium]|nr:SprT family zinc-dependent metalloprotease [Candidatus Cloacimonadota bacterium]